MLPFFRNGAGFSLVELVTVLVLISILSVFAAPRMMGTAGTDQYVVRDQLISAIRFVQQRSMQDQASTHCYRIHIMPSNFSVERAATAVDPYVAINDFAFGEEDASVARALQNVTLSAITLFFDGLGNPLNTCRGSTVANQSVSIMAVGATPICIDIFSTGYVRAAACS